MTPDASRDRNPAANIADIRRGRMVIKNGTLYSANDVYQAAGIAPSK